MDRQKLAIYDDPGADLKGMFHRRWRQNSGTIRTWTFDVKFNDLTIAISRLKSVAILFKYIK